MNEPPPSPPTPHEGPFKAGLQPGSRLLAALLLAISGGLLLTASSLTASDSGMGTHQQLNLPPCGFLAGTGLPCASCGMTTAFSHAADGALIAAVLTQPAGAVLALFTAMLAVASGWALLAGLNLVPLLRMLWCIPVLIGLVLLIALGWGWTLGRTLGGW